MRRLTLLLFFLTLILLALFPKPLFLSYIKWKMHHWVKVNCGGSLSYNSLKLESGNLKLRQANIHAPFFDLTVEEATLGLFSHELKVSGVKTTVYKRNDFDLGWVQKLLTSESKKVSITNGTCLLYDYTGEDAPLFQKMEWQLVDHTLSFKMQNLDLPVEVKILKENKFQAKWENQPVAHLYTLFHYFFGRTLEPDYTSWVFSRGTSSCDIEFAFANKELKTIKGTILCDDVRGKNNALSLLCRLDHFDSSFDMDVNALSISSLKYKLKSGCLSLMEGSTEEWEGLWDLHFYNSAVVINNGKIESSSALVNLLGMDGHVLLKSQPQDPLLSVKFVGNSKKMLPLIPFKFQNAFEQAFPDDEFFLSAVLKKNALGVDLEGQLVVNDSSGESNHLAFGCHFGKKESAKKTPPEDKQLHLSNLKDHFSISKKSIGWFRGNHFRAEKFLSPFLFRKNDFHLSGFIDFEGTFDERICALYYKGCDVTLENPHLKINTSLIKNGISSDIVACHYIDLKNFDHVGFLPIHNATYHQKKPDFTLRDASFTAYFENKKIEIRNISANSEDLHFKGKVKIDYPVGENVVLGIEAEKIWGKISSARNFLACLAPHMIWKLPLQGHVECKEGNYFRINFTPAGKSIEGQLHGEILAECANAFAELKDYHIYFDYDHGAANICFHDGGGWVNMKDGTGLRLVTPNITIKHFSDLELAFKARLLKGGQEIYQLNCEYEKKDQKKYLTIDGNLLNLSGHQEGLSLVIDKFNMSKWSGKGAINWETFPIGISFEDFRVCDLPIGLSFVGKLGLPSKGLKGPLTVDDLEFVLTGEKGNWCEKIAQKESFKGKLALEMASTGPELALTLKDGIYEFLGKEHQIRNFVVKYDSSWIQMSGQLLHQNTFYPVALSIDAGSPKRGTVAIKENLSSLETLVFHWRKSQVGEIEIDHVQGKFSGFDVFLQNSGTQLLGRVEVDVERAQKILPETFANHVERLGLKGNYLLEGEFQLPIRNKNDIKFAGTVRGSNFTIGNLQLDELSSVLSLTSDKIELKHLVIDDPCGHAEIEKAEFEKENGNLKFSIPQIKIEQVHFSRLKTSLLKKNRKTFTKPLIIQSFHVNHMAGVWGEPSTYTGIGELRFTNLERKNLFSNLLFLPKEITARIGLDLRLLVPAQGVIQYEIHDGKIFLTKLKGMYSEGKRSRFYLAEGHPATIDFEGNLNLKVKMKQYNLLMKVAELFVLTVKGDIFKPSYTFVSLFDDEEKDEG